MKIIESVKSKVKFCIARVVRSAIKQMRKKEYDAYCPTCAAYIVNQRVTFEERCDQCGTPVEWR